MSSTVFSVAVDVFGGLEEGEEEEDKKERRRRAKN